MHAVIHAIVENQIAAAELPVRGTAQRLMSEGLDRHQAIHAIGSVLVGYLNERMPEVKSGGEHADVTPGRDPNDDYFAELDILTADEWLRSALTTASTLAARPLGRKLALPRGIEPLFQP